MTGTENIEEHPATVKPETLAIDHLRAALTLAWLSVPSDNKELHREIRNALADSEHLAVMTKRPEAT